MWRSWATARQRYATPGSGGRIHARLGHHGPGVKTASTPDASLGSGTWKPRRSPAMPVGPTQERHNSPAGNEGQQANASNRKATGTHNRLDRATADGESRLTWPGGRSRRRRASCSSRDKLDASRKDCKRTREANGRGRRRLATRSPFRPQSVTAYLPGDTSGRHQEGALVAKTSAAFQSCSARYLRLF